MNMKRYLVIFIVSCILPSAFTKNFGPFPGVDPVSKVPRVPEDNCKHPKLTYVRWHDVRKYVNEYLKDLNIPSSITGQPLPVHRCGNDLTPCGGPGSSSSFCGPYEEHLVKKGMPLSDGNHELILEYYEDKMCRCMDEKMYDQNHRPDYTSPPYIQKAYVRKISFQYYTNKRNTKYT
ncbi:hypothetical protein SK128_012478 [Halocaridina rubra]|uniref:Uncharacterized protein n=1 Tax=Halocaridina rubra TaxID=373956 RepID=A0AAN8WY50_HALRR